jgi:hypothetical protein
MAYPSGAVQITGFIGTTSILDTYATHLDFLGFGGFRSVTNIAERDLITTDRRVFGMVVSTQDGNGSYILANLVMGGVDNDVTNNANWIAYTTGGGGGGGLISLTNADMLLLITTNTVVPAQFYLITDATYTDGGVVVQGIEVGSKPTLQGSGLFLNADYQSVGDYSGVGGFASALGLWSKDVQPVVVGDCVVYNNFNFVNLTGNWGNEPSTDAVNWQPLTKNVTNGYIKEIDFVKYDVTTNQILYRADLRGNEVELSNTFPESLVLFQWGRNFVSNNKVSNRSFMVCTNSNCVFRGNILTNNSVIEDSSDKVDAGIINYNTVSNEGYIKLSKTKGNVSYNTVDGLKSEIRYNGLVNTIDTSVNITYNFLRNGGYIKYDNITGISNLVNNNIELGGFTLGVQNGGDITQNNIFGGVIDISSFTFSGGFSDNQINTTSSYGINILILSTIISGRALRNGYSNFQETLDLTDPTIWNGIDTITIPNDKQYAGEFTVSNASLLTPVSKIKTLPTNHPCRFTPKNLSQCAFAHTLVAFSTPDDLLCDAPSSVNVLTGRADGSDFIEYQLSGDKLLRTNLVLVA